MDPRPDTSSPEPADTADAVDAAYAADPSPRVTLDYGGFWIGSRDASPSFVAVTPIRSLPASALHTLSAWVRHRRPETLSEKLAEVNARSRGERL